MTKFNLITVVLLLLGLNTTSHLVSATEFSCNVPISSFSDREKVAKGDLSANVFWKEVKLNSNSIGYGPAEHKLYELTIANGNVFMSQPSSDNKGVLVRTDPKMSEGAIMLQVATPNAWSTYDSISQISSLTEMSEVISHVFDKLLCKDEDVLAFKIKGLASSLSWSMDTKKRKVVNSFNEEIEIIGLFSKANHKKYFLLSQYNLHAHVVLKNTIGAGHLRNVALNKGAILYLPNKLQSPTKN